MEFFAEELPSLWPAVGSSPSPLGPRSPLGTSQVGPASAFPLPISADLRENLEEVLPRLQAENVRCFYLSLSSPTPEVAALGAALEVAPPDPVPADLRAGITPRSPALFIYTSGTTGEGTQPP